MPARFGPEPAPVITPANDDAAALCAASEPEAQVCREGRDSSWSNARILSEWKDRARKIPHIAKVTIFDRHIEFTPEDGPGLIDVLRGPTFGAYPASIRASGQST